MTLDIEDDEIVSDKGEVNSKKCMPTFKILLSFKLI